MSALVKSQRIADQLEGMEVGKIQMQDSEVGAIRLDHVQRRDSLLSIGQPRGREAAPGEASPVPLSPASYRRRFCVRESAPCPFKDS